MAFTRKPPPGNARRVRCMGHNLRGVTTNKCGHLVQFESELEHTLILLLERDHAVADYRSQPEVLRFQDAAGQARTYTPDFQVWRTDGHIEIHEVSIESRRAARTSLGQREAAATAICRERGWRYVVHTDRTLPTGYEYSNLSFLAAYRARVYDDEAMRAWWLAQLAGRAAVGPCAAVAHLTADDARGGLLANLYHLLWHDIVQMDWRRPLVGGGDLHPAARVWLPTQGVLR